MSDDRKRGRRGSRRAFRPTLEGGLESRFLLSGGAAHVHTAAVTARPQRVPPIRSIQTANGGQSVVITDGVGTQFEVTVTSLLQVAGAKQINAGTVQARRLPGGKVALTVKGTTQDSDVAINPVIQSPVKGGAHDFASGQVAMNRLLNVGSITVTSGTVGRIEGYRSAILSGPVIIPSANLVDRIAFASIAPGASIFTGGDLNTLDVLTDLDIANGATISVGRDLNILTVQGNVNITGGSSLVIGRDYSANAQGAKGTAPAPPGGIIFGNVTISPDSVWIVKRDFAAPIQVLGNFSGATRVFQLGPNPGTPFIVRGTITP
jgi:hypothetical protein